jgi:hypothetical protein
MLKKRFSSKHLNFITSAAITLEVVYFQVLFSLPERYFFFLLKVKRQKQSSKIRENTGSET